MTGSSPHPSASPSSGTDSRRDIIGGQRRAGFEVWAWRCAAACPPHPLRSGSDSHAVEASVLCFHGRTAHGGALSMIAPQGQGQPSNSHVFCFSTITLEYLYQMKTLYFDDDRCHYPFGEVHVLFLIIHLLRLLVVQD